MAKVPAIAPQETIPSGLREESDMTEKTDGKKSRTSWFPERGNRYLLGFSALYPAIVAGQTCRAGVRIACAEGVAP